MIAVRYIGLGIVFLTGLRAAAAIRPSFSLDYSVWGATHVVLATEGDAVDGRLKVLESWKGDLGRGSQLVLPELAAFADEQQRRVHWWDLNDLPVPYVRSVTGSRVVLFLVKTVEQRNGDHPDSASVVWKPACIGGYGGFKVSVAWIERGETYVFRQTLNPGPTRLEHLGTAIEMKARVAAFVTINSDLEIAVSENDPIRAAQVFRAFRRNGFHYAERASLESIGKMGKSSLQTLRNLGRRDPEIISAMVVAGGKAVAPDLTRIVAEELDFWSKRACDLKEGWWNADPADERQVLRGHYSTLLAALRGLAPLRHEACRDVVAQTRKLWQSTPALHEVGNGQMVRTCDAVMAGLPSR